MELLGCDLGAVTFRYQTRVAAMLRLVDR